MQVLLPIEHINNGWLVCNKTNRTRATAPTPAQILSEDKYCTRVCPACSACQEERATALSQGLQAGSAIQEYPQQQLAFNAGMQMLLPAVHVHVEIPDLQSYVTTWGQSWADKSWHHGVAHLNKREATTTFLTQRFCCFLVSDSC